MCIASVALAVMTIAVMMTVSALNAIANSKNETAPRWYGSGASFHYGIAHGRSAEDFPRNRTKSVTAATNFLRERPTPAAEIFQLEQRERLTLDIPFDSEAFSPESIWENRASHDWEKGYYREMRRLGQEIHGGARAQGRELTSRAFSIYMP